MYAKATNPAEAWVTPATEAFEFWVSLWPTAPLFGVEWRFAGAIADTNPFTKVEIETPVLPVDVVAPVAAAVEIMEIVKVETVAEGDPTIETKAEPAMAKPALLMATAPAKVDDLTLIKGVGPGTAGQLNGLGVYTFAQIAGFSEAEMTWIDSNLTSLKGRCFRDGWVAQAKGLLD